MPVLNRGGGTYVTGAVTLLPLSVSSSEEYNIDSGAYVDDTARERAFFEIYPRYSGDGCVFSIFLNGAGRYLFRAEFTPDEALALAHLLIGREINSG